VSDLSDEARHLIRTATGADGPSEDRIDAIGDRLFRTLGAAAGSAGALSAAKVALASAPAAPAAKALSAGILGYFVAGGAAGVGVALVGAALGAFGAEPSTQPPRPSPPATAAVPRAGDGVQRSIPAPAPLASLALPSAEPKRSAELAPNSTANDVPATDLAREVSALNEVQSWLSRGDGARALAASDRYFAEHRSGALRDEHVAARVLALCLLGDVTRARDAARMFVARSPNSPLLPRLSRSCVADLLGHQKR